MTGHFDDERALSDAYSDHAREQQRCWAEPYRSRHDAATRPVNRLYRFVELAAVALVVLIVLYLGIIYLTPETPSGRYLLVMGITLWF